MKKILPLMDDIRRPHLICHDQHSCDAELNAFHASFMVNHEKVQSEKVPMGKGIC